MVHPLNFQQFQALLDEVQAQYNAVFKYNNVWWLSKGQVLERFVACVGEIRLLMNENGHEYPQRTDMAYLISCFLQILYDTSIY